MGTVQYIGLKELGDEAYTAQQLVEKYAEKFDRWVPDAGIVFHSKLHDIGGRVKYSLHARIDSPGFVAKAEAVDWDLKRTVHKVMKALENDVEHKLKIHAQKQERFHPRRARRGTDTRIKLKQRRRARVI